jgi:hypothetical protein
VVRLKAEVPKGKILRKWEVYLPSKKNESQQRLLMCINATLQKKAKDIIVLNWSN